MSLVRRTTWGRWSGSGRAGRVSPAGLWARCTSRFSVYGASEAARLNPQFMPLDGTYRARRFSRSDGGGPYDAENLTAGDYRPHSDSGQPWHGFDPSARRRCWAVPSNILAEIGLSSQAIKAMSMREKLDALDEAGYIIHPDKPGGFPATRSTCTALRAGRWATCGPTPT